MVSNMWGLIDKVETLAKPTLKRQLAKTCEFYIEIKMNRYYYLCMQDMGFLLDWSERKLKAYLF